MTDEELTAVETNLYGVAQIDRPQPYLSTQEDREKWMQFDNIERCILNARVRELKTRAEQIKYIYQVKQSGLYLVAADYGKSPDSCFHDWLTELFMEGVPYGASRMTNRGMKWKWDEIEDTINVCLSKKLSLDEATQVAVVGIKALEIYIKTGIISVQGDGYGPEEPKNSEEEQADILRELAQAKSSRGATMIAKSATGAIWLGVANLWKEKDPPYQDSVVYRVMVKKVIAGGESSEYPIEVVIPEGTPTDVTKWALNRISSMADAVS